MSLCLRRSLVNVFSTYRLFPLAGGVRSVRSGVAATPETSGLGPAAAQSGKDDLPDQSDVADQKEIDGVVSTFDTQKRNEYQGSERTPGRFAPRYGDQPQRYTAYVRGLPKGATADDLKKVFAKFAPGITAIDLKSTEGYETAIAFVNFNSAHHYYQALSYNGMLKMDETADQTIEIWPKRRNSSYEGGYGGRYAFGPPRGGAYGGGSIATPSGRLSRPRGDQEFDDDEGGIDDDDFEGDKSPRGGYRGNISGGRGQRPPWRQEPRDGGFGGGRPSRFASRREDVDEFDDDDDEDKPQRGGPGGRGSNFGSGGGGRGRFGGRPPSF